MIKKILIVSGTIAVTLLLIIQFTRPVNQKIVSVLEDVTDDSLMHIDHSKVEDFFQFDHDQWQGGIFRYSTLTDLSLNEAKEKSIPDELALLSNEFDRAKKIKEFDQFITETLTKKVIAQPANYYRCRMSLEITINNLTKMWGLKSKQLIILV